MKKIENRGIIRQMVLLLFLVGSLISFSKNFWEKSSFTVDVVETIKVNKVVLLMQDFIQFFFPFSLPFFLLQSALRFDFKGFM